MNSGFRDKPRPSKPIDSIPTCDTCGELCLGSHDLTITCERCAAHRIGLCPVHSTISTLEPFQNCVACIRNHRDELITAIKRAVKALRFADQQEGRMVTFSELASELEQVASLIRTACSPEATQKEQTPAGPAADLSGGEGR